MAASVLYSCLRAAATLRSHQSRTALRAAAQVWRPSPLSLRESAGERARFWEVLDYLTTMYSKYSSHSKGISHSMST
nr:uncharacterized protein LOC118968039 isoform X2 [Manis javanica]